MSNQPDWALCPEKDKSNEALETAKPEPKEDKPDEAKLKVYGKVTNGEYLPDFPDGVPRHRNKVAIVGFAPSCYDVRILHDDPTWEIWGINQLYLQMPGLPEKSTRWFQIHHRESYDHAVRDHKHHDWLAAQTMFPIYMQKREPDIPMSIPYPEKEMVEYFGDYWTNSISWMIALAIYERFEKLHLYGVDMATDEEYREQRPSCEWLIGWAQCQMGKENIYIPAKSDLLKSVWRYPYEDDKPFRAKIDGRKTELRQRMLQTRGQKLNLHDQEMQLMGALDNMDYILKTWSNTVREQTPGQVIVNR